MKEDAEALFGDGSGSVNSVSAESASGRSRY